MDFMAQKVGDGEAEENERYVWDVIGIRHASIRITWNLWKKLLITSEQHPFAGASEANKNAELRS